MTAIGPGTKPKRPVMPVSFLGIALIIRVLTRRVRRMLNRELFFWHSWLPLCIGQQHLRQRGPCLYHHVWLLRRLLSVVFRAVRDILEGDAQAGLSFSF